MPTDDLFLSEQNPIATTHQREQEDLAMRICARPEVQKARGMAEFLWREGMQHYAQDQWHLFGQMIDEYAYHYAMRTVASDAFDPKVVRFMVPPHRWFGRDVPGSRWGGDSPDFVYRIIPIEHGGRFEIKGRPVSGGPASAHYAQMGENTSAPTILNLLDVVGPELDANGEFTITVDDTPADGRPMHIQTLPGARQIWVRDALGDWNNQFCNALTVNRLDTPSRGPLSEQELAERCARAMVDGVYYTFWCIHTCIGLPANQMSAPMSSAGFGGMASQYTAKVNCVLEPDEAMIVRANEAGARFRNFVPSDKFMISVNYWEKMGSLNMHQMAPDADGRFTYVIAHEDPGTHNWIDTSGLRQMIIGQRWQAFGPGGPTEEPWISARVVKFRDLQKELVDGTAMIDAEGRKAQIAQRLAGFRRRFLDS